MKNKDIWKPSKFVITKHGLMASRDLREVSMGSRLIADIVAKAYERAIREHARGLLLDLGCGKVPLYETYRKYISDNICIDWVHTLHKNPYLDYEFDVNQKIPLSDKYFDTILLTDVLEHLSTPSLIFHEISRLLKPSGKIIIGVPFIYWIHESPYDYYRYTEHALRMLCKDNDLNIISLEVYGGAPEIILDIIAKNIAFSHFFSRAHLFLSKCFINSVIGRRISARTLQQFPLGYCLIAQKQL